MKILVANKMDWEHPHAGGVEVNLRETLSRLSERGHEVHLLTARYPGSDGYEELEGVKIHRYGLRGRTNEIFILTVGQLYLSYLARKLEPDVTYTVNSIAGWFPLTRAPHINAVHHIYGKTIFGQFDFPLNLAGYVMESVSLFLSRKDRAVSVSPSTTRELVDRGFHEDNITEIINGVDTGKYTPGEESEEPKVLYLGRLEYNKGIDMIPDIYGQLQDALEFDLDIAGFGSQEQLVEQMAEEKDNVTFQGYVDESKKIRLLQEAWVVLVPSRVEGWGMIVSEANACGTPVVGFDVDGLTDSVENGENGFLTPLDSEDALEGFSRKVIELLGDDSLRQRMSDKARSLSESRSWENAADTLENLFTDISGTGGKRDLT